MDMSRWKLARWGKLLPVIILYQSFGCLPDNAFRQVLSENLLQTASIVIQSATSLFFGNILGFI